MLRKKYSLQFLFVSHVKSADSLRGETSEKNLFYSLHIRLYIRFEPNIAAHATQYYIIWLSTGASLSNGICDAGAGRGHNISGPLCDAAGPAMGMTMVHHRVDKQLVAAQEDERKITLVRCVTAGA